MNYEIRIYIATIQLAAEDSLMVYVPRCSMPEDAIQLPSLGY